MIDPRRTGAIISQFRKQQDWTQLQLASQLHVTHQAVSRWESGESFPDLAILDAIARLFDVPVDELLYGESARANGSPALEFDGVVAHRLEPGETEVEFSYFPRTLWPGVLLALAGLAVAVVRPAQLRCMLAMMRAPSMSKRKRSARKP